jgi:hypothetical protein
LNGNRNREIRLVGQPESPPYGDLDDEKAWGTMIFAGAAAFAMRQYRARVPYWV